MKKMNMDGFLKVVGIVVAAGTLVSAIFTKNESEMIEEIVDKKVEEKLAEALADRQ
jgi:hypothetical protein